MKKFIAIYHTPAEVIAQNSKMTKEDHAKGMKAWFDWKDKCGDHIVDFGAPLMPGKTIDQKGNWNQVKTSVNGYSILQGKSLKEVQALFKKHPHLSWGEGCSVEVHEFAAV